MTLILIVQTSFIYKCELSWPNSIINISIHSKMLYNHLGQSGLKISKVILGTMSYGSSECHEWICNEHEALPLIKHAFDVGINTWDTADTYSNGLSETIIGKALKQYDIPRAKVVIMTKCYFGVSDDGSQPPIAGLSNNDGEMVNRVGLSRKHILDAVDASVARLGTYIDVLQIHRFDPNVPKDEIMRALNDVIETGKVRYIGASTVIFALSFIKFYILTRHRWQLGSFRAFKTPLMRTAGTSSCQCKIIIISYTEKKV